MLRGKRVLVTGGAGFIASHIVDKLVNEGCDVVVVDNLKDGALDNLGKSINKIDFKEVDIRDFNALKVLLADVEIVFHLASNANVPFSVENPKYDFETNADGTFNILRCSMDNDVQRIIYASTAAVYGEPEYTPIDEKHTINPISPYGASKLAGERLGLAYYHTYGIPFVAMRIFNTYGPRQRRYVMYDFLKKLKADPKKLEVLGTGEQIRDYCYVADTANAFISSAECEGAIGEVFNIAGGNPISIKELTELMIRLLGLDGKTEISYTGKSWKGDIVKLIADIEKIKNRLQFKPTTKLEDGLAKLIDWFEEEFI
ncbi:MAG: SDR family NAD(P)-dependent oxidoreductase [Thermotogota bacterium]|nr:SDR family NAD(P)-dependent oxidoreductase [Thermotogota bacterium]